MTVHEAISLFADAKIVLLPLYLLIGLAAYLWYTGDDKLCKTVTTVFKATFVLYAAFELAKITLELYVWYFHVPLQCYLKVPD